MRIFRLSVLLAATCFSITMATAATLQELPGYSRLTVSAAFETHLNNNPTLISALAAQPELSKLVLSRAALQQQLTNGQLTLADIQKQYLPATVEQPAEKPTAAVTPAQGLLQRAISSLRSDNARQRAAQDIDTAIENTANDTTTPSAAAEAMTVAELIAYIRNNPDLAEQLLTNPDVLARLGDAGIKPNTLRADTAVTRDNQRSNNDNPVSNPPSGSSGGIAAPGGTDAPSVPEQPQILASYDINAIPQGDGLALDANGWPKYLKVPADCPGPKSGVAYEHSHKGYMAAIYSRGVPGSGVAANTTVNAPFGPQAGAGYPGLIIESIWIRGQTLLSVPGNGSQEFALPFNADNQPKNIGSGSFYTAGGALEAAVAYCPGDFTNITPAGKPALSARCVSPSDSFHAAVEPYREGRERADYAGNDITPCFIEPGERYYVNLRPHQEHCLNEYEHCGSMFAASIGQMHSFGRYPPYAGPCLDNGPYPQNYRNRLCGESQVIDTDCREEGSNQYWSCYDPQDILPAQSYARTCSSDGTRIAWTEGYRKPTSSRYVCESKTVSRSMSQTFVSDDTAYEFDKETGGDGSGRDFVCAAHREGQFRELGAGHPAVSNNPQTYPYKVTEQCQFNAESRRYDWVEVERSHMTRGRTQTANRVRSLPVAPSHAGCKIAGTVHPVGTRFTNDCGSIHGRALYECKASGVARNSEETMLNSLQLIEGSPMGLMRDGCTQTVEAP